MTSFSLIFWFHKSTTYLSKMLEALHCSIATLTNSMSLSRTYLCHLNLLLIHLSPQDAGNRQQRPDILFCGRQCGDAEYRQGAQLPGDGVSPDHMECDLILFD